jgi:hypothetical protein
LYSAPDILECSNKENELIGMCGNMGEMRNAYKLLIGISQGKVYLLEDLRFHKRKMLK